MRAGRRTAFIALPTAAALLLTACGGGDNGGDSAADPNSEVTVFTTEPENPLIPGGTNETGGGRVVDTIFSMLVRYDNEDASSINEVAESIEADEDGRVFTITIKDDWKFHDGTDVTAQSFVDAWNWVAYAPNGALNASFFEKIEGYEDVHPADEGEEPTAETMSGLEVIDEHTFQVTLSAPFAIFPETLGYSAYAPLPEAFFEDQEAWEAEPIGNGPFQFVSRVPDQEIKLTRFEDYAGEQQPQIENLTYKVYQSLDAAYTAVVSNDLDVLDQIPVSALAGDAWKTDLEGRTLEVDLLLSYTLSFPLYDEVYEDVNLRRALSLAINREEMAEQIFFGNRLPAQSRVPAVLLDDPEGQCEYCDYDPERAKQLLAESGYTGDVGITYNSDGDHQQWVEAACNSIANTLEIGCNPEPVQTFNVQREIANAREFTTMYRTGWKADYPSIENFLTPLLRTGASSNDGDYSNPEVDAKLDEADQASSVEEATELYMEAERMINEDMPSIPVFDDKGQAGHSTRVENVHLNPLRTLDVLSLSLA
ncbi:peptide ABC transporter substrate-binding protein [Actinoalloteichus spitiensis]|uniref:peptide ABC transporter substrate-binding protein n=1 Tax=Actinoalloteichus spitiensis TaxID=252394 RepID=UPI00037F49F8|nr:ABC transporter substrate-binding protein [Actinoalloteichus spitiensis]